MTERHGKPRWEPVLMETQLQHWSFHRKQKLRNNNIPDKLLKREIRGSKLFIHTTALVVFVRIHTGQSTQCHEWRNILNDCHSILNINVLSLSDSEPTIRVEKLQIKFTLENSLGKANQPTETLKETFNANSANHSEFWQNNHSQKIFYINRGWWNFWEI
jgi:hypothetical protein